MPQELLARTLIITNGSLEQPEIIAKRLAAWGKFSVVVADGAVRHADHLKLAIDAVVGDLDSLDPDTAAWLKARGTHFQVSPTHKDQIDLELALEYAITHRAEEMVITGVLGDRLDMTIANVLLLAHARFRHLSIAIWNAHQTAWIIHPPGDECNGNPGDTLSLIPLFGDASGVVTNGLEYPLHGETLSSGLARGLSNVLMASSAHVSLETGMLLAIHTPGRA